jgi:hypothetical protein
MINMLIAKPFHKVFQHLADIWYSRRAVHARPCAQSLPVTLGIEETDHASVLPDDS